MAGRRTASTRSTSSIQPRNGSRRPRREAFLSGPASLTPSERRIAEIAAVGRTNREIAQTLFVTPKTVEYHLRNAYRKLGIDTRRELAEALIT
jgi:DNA-binding CsgD family transcriptional regulator